MLYVNHIELPFRWNLLCKPPPKKQQKNSKKNPNQNKTEQQWGEMRRLQHQDFIWCDRTHLSSGGTSGWVLWWCHRSPARSSSRWRCELYSADTLEKQFKHLFIYFLTNKSYLRPSKEQLATLLSYNLNRMDSLRESDVAEAEMLSYFLPVQNLGTTLTTVQLQQPTVQSQFWLCCAGSS